MARTSKLNEHRSRLKKTLERGRHWSLFKRCRRDGGKAHPWRIANLINPNLVQLSPLQRRKQGTYRRPRVKSAVPGCALRLSVAPPTTMVIAEPGPDRRIFEHNRLLTLHMPIARSMSRYKGMLKLLARVRRCGLIPGNASGKPVAGKRECKLLRGSAG